MRMQLTAHAGRSARLCEDTKGAANAMTNAAASRNFIMNDQINSKKEYARYRSERLEDMRL
jgi:hypothetical protein